VSAGAQLGVVSSSDATSFLKKALSQLLPSAFTTELLDSDAFQAGGSDKAQMLKIILDFYGVDPGCVVYFDDAPKKAAEQVGTHYKVVNPKTGLLQSDVLSALSALPSKCNLGTLVAPQETTTRVSGWGSLAPPPPEYFDLPEYVDPPPPPAATWSRSVSMSRICMFDVSGTLLVNGRMSPFARQAIDICLQSDMKIGIAEGSFENSQQVMAFLEEINPKIFFPGFFQSPAFQIGQKEAMLANILAHFNGDPRCSIMFDDNHEAEARQLGLNFKLVQSSIGLTKEDFDQAWIQMDQRCPQQAFSEPARGAVQPVTVLGEEGSKCPDLYFPKPTTVPSQCVNKRHGELCQVQCAPHYQSTSGDAVITCLNGKWSGTPLRCEYLPGERFERSLATDRVAGSKMQRAHQLETRRAVQVKCPDLNFPSGVRPTACRRFTHGKVCHMSCEPGFVEAGGNDSMICLHGEWSGVPLQCALSFEDDQINNIIQGSYGMRDSSKNCPNLFLPDGAHVSPPECVGKEVCQFTCLPGWTKTFGQERLLCRDGQWSGAPLQCTRRANAEPQYRRMDQTRATMVGTGQPLQYNGFFPGELLSDVQRP
jgi:FMN phosphatase YigB (HAD superfamily)